MSGYFGKPCRDQKFGCREKHGHEPARDQIVQFLFRLRQVSWQLRRRNNGEVVGYLRVVENPLVRFDPMFFQNLRRIMLIVGTPGQTFQRLHARLQIIFRQMT